MDLNACAYYAGIIENNRLWKEYFGIIRQILSQIVMCTLRMSDISVSGSSDLDESVDGHAR